MLFKEHDVVGRLTDPHTRLVGPRGQGPRPGSLWGSARGRFVSVLVHKRKKNVCEDLSPSVYSTNVAAVCGCVWRRRESPASFSHWHR